MFPLACSCRVLAMSSALSSATNWFCGGWSTSTLVCPSSEVRPASAWARAAVSALVSSPDEICSTRKKPSTAMTRADRTSVVETTLSCSERCQRLRTCATM